MSLHIKVKARYLPLVVFKPDFLQVPFREHLHDEIEDTLFRVKYARRGIDNEGEALLRGVQNFGEPGQQFHAPG